MKTEMDHHAYLENRTHKIVLSCVTDYSNSEASDYGSMGKSPCGRRKLWPNKERGCEDASRAKANPSNNEEKGAVKEKIRYANAHKPNNASNKLRYDKDRATKVSC